MQRQRAAPQREITVYGPLTHKLPHPPPRPGFQLPQSCCSHATNARQRLALFFHASPTLRCRLLPDRSPAGHRCARPCPAAAPARAAHLARPLAPQRRKHRPRQLRLLGAHVDEVGAQRRGAVRVGALQAKVHAAVHVVGVPERSVRRGGAVGAAERAVRVAAALAGVALVDVGVQVGKGGEQHLWRGRRRRRVGRTGGGRGFRGRRAWLAWRALAQQQASGILSAASCGEVRAAPVRLPLRGPRRRHGPPPMPYMPSAPKRSPRLTHLALEVHRRRPAGAGPLPGRVDARNAPILHLHVHRREVVDTGLQRAPLHAGQAAQRHGGVQQQVVAALGQAHGAFQ